MSAEPQDLPPAAEVPPKESKVVIRKGQVVTIAGKEFRLEMNAVISGQRADLVAAGLEPI